MSTFYNNYFEQVGKAGIDFSSDTFKAMLMTTSYTFDDTDAFRADLAGEASGTNYTAGGQAVDSVTITQDDTNNYAVVDFADETFTNVTISAVDSYVLYKDTGNIATDLLIAHITFTEGAQSTVANDFILTPNASGVLTIG